MNELLCPYCGCDLKKEGLIETVKVYIDYECFWIDDGKPCRKTLRDMEEDAQQYFCISCLEEITDFLNELLRKRGVINE